MFCPTIELIVWMERTIPCTKVTRSAATLLRFLNTCNGIRGYLATFFSLKKKINMATLPKTSRQITFGELHEKVSPPKLRPSRSMSVTPRTDKLPAL